MTDPWGLGRAASLSDNKAPVDEAMESESNDDLVGEKLDSEGIDDFPVEDDIAGDGVLRGPPPGSRGAGGGDNGVVDGVGEVKVGSDVSEIPGSGPLLGATFPPLALLAAAAAAFFLPPPPSRRSHLLALLMALTSMTSFVPSLERRPEEEEKESPLRPLLVVEFAGTAGMNSSRAAGSGSTGAAMETMAIVDLLLGMAVDW